MVGRRDRQVFQQPANVESQSSGGGGSKFRRKLSHGLAIISNPLSQRKTTPGRHQVQAPSLAVSEPTTTDRPTTLCDCDAPLSPGRNSNNFEHSTCSLPKPATPVNNQSPAKSVEPDSTPRPLPRSRTVSFIPRPVKSESAIYMKDVESLIKPQPPALMSDPKPRVTSSRIPTPSPPLSERRNFSPRQHNPRHTSQQERRIAAASTFVGEHNGSPAKFASRSRTTPNLVNSTTSPGPAQPTSSLAPQKTGLKRPATSPTVQKLVLQENIPTNQHVSHRRSQIQERPLKRESLAVPGANSNRRSFGPGGPLGECKQPNFATPPPASKRLSSQFTQQTPVTAKRVLPKVQVDPHVEDQSQVGIDSIAQSRLMGPRNPPTPTVCLPKIALPRSSTEKDLGRKTLGTPNGLGGVWRSSRALAVTNHEVRRLPRSLTFHNFGTQWESTPPVPPIPERYRTPSWSDLTRCLHMDPDTSVKPRPAKMISEATSCQSIPEERDEDGRHSSANPTPSRTRLRRHSTLEPSYSTDSLTAQPPVAPALSSSTNQQSLLGDSYGTQRPVSQNGRPWSISECHSSESANVDPFLQVKDYMPPLYWAGRFQSRFDQWRTEAMMAHLNPSHEPVGPLGECKLDQEKLAACYIFAQLRDLCTSNQAADSLWEFEFKYRKDNKLLGNPLDVPNLPSRKHDDHSTHKGAFGRAVRKLTPRKTSLVNLLKGKGWNKGEEKANDEPEHSLETSSSSS